MTKKAEDNNSLRNLMDEVLHLSDVLGVSKLRREIDLIKNRFISPPYIVEVVLSIVLKEFNITRGQLEINSETKAKKPEIIDARTCFVIVLNDYLNLNKSNVMPVIKGSENSYYTILQAGRQLDPKINHMKELLSKIDKVIEDTEKITEIKIKR